MRREIQLIILSSFFFLIGTGYKFNAMLVV